MIPDFNYSNLTPKHDNVCQHPACFTPVAAVVPVNVCAVLINNSSID